MSQNKVEVTISNRTVVRVLALVLVTILGVQFLINVSHTLQLILISAFLSIALNPAVRWISKHLHLKRRAAATGIAYLFVVVVLFGFSSFVFPPLIKETVDFVRQAPEAVSALNDENSGAGKFVKRYNLEDAVSGLSDNISERTKNLQEPVIATASRVGSALISIVTVLVLTFMMLVEGPLWVKKFWDMHPKHRREHDKEIAQRMYRVVTGYVNGQVILAALAASVIMTALIISSTILNVSVNVVALAGLAFITGLIPMIGQIIGGTIVVFACLLVSVPLAIVMAIFILFYQQVENISLQPYIQSKYNELSPLLVFVAALLGVGFGGLLGAFVAIPAFGCAKILAEDYLATRGIGRR